MGRRGWSHVGDGFDTSASLVECSNARSQSVIFSASRTNKLPRRLLLDLVATRDKNIEA